MKSKFWFFVVASSGLLIADQLTKHWARTAAQNTEGRTILVVWPNILEFKLVFNEGVAFGMFQGAGRFLAPVGLVIMAATVWYSYRRRNDHLGLHLTLALLCAGACGNLIDRALHGQVTDMVYVRAIDFPVFNVADICISLAGAAIIVSALADAFRRQPDPPADSPDPV